MTAKTWKLDNGKCYKVKYAVQAALRITEKIPERLWILVLPSKAQIRIQSGHVIEGRRYLESALYAEDVVKAFAYVVQKPLTAMEAYLQGEGH